MKLFLFFLIILEVFSETPLEQSCDYNYCYGDEEIIINFSFGKSEVPWIEQSVQKDKYTKFVLTKNVDSVFKRYFEGFENIKEIIIDDSIKNIDEEAFANMQNLETVHLSTSFTTIPKGLFKNCPKLKTVNIEPTLTSIGEYAFQNANIESIILPNDLTIIEQYTFSGCRNLKNVTFGNKIESIQQKAFENCTLLESVIIPPNVTTIGEDAFAFCSSMHTLILNEVLITIEKGAFKWCSSLKSLKLPLSLQTLGDDAFRSSYNIHTLDVYDKIINKGVDTLFGMWIDNLIVRTVENMTDIDNKTLQFWDEIREQPEKLIIEGSAERIGQRVFADFERLIEITFSPSIKTIGEEAFKNCSKLKHVVIPETVKVLEKNAFTKCPILEFVYFEGKKKPICNLSPFSHTKVEIVHVEQSYEDLSFCSHFIKMDCGQNVQCIVNSTTEKLIITGSGDVGNVTFSDEIKKKIKEVEVTDGIKAFEDSIFEDFKEMKSLSLGRDVEFIDNVIFEGCDNFEEFKVSKDNRHFSVEDNVLYEKHFTILFKYPTGLKNETFVVPTTVTQIGERAFAFNEYIKEIIINNNISRIGLESFAECINLKTIKYNAVQEPNCDDDVFGDSYNITLTVHSDYPKNKTFCFEEVIYMGTDNNNNKDDSDTKELWIIISSIAGAAVVLALCILLMIVIGVCIADRYCTKGFKQFEDESEDGEKIFEKDRKQDNDPYETNYDGDL